MASNNEKDFQKGFTCPSCGSFVKEYRRSLNANMALALICLYKHARNKFVKVEDLLLEKGYSRCGDFSYGRFYGFIEPLKEKRADGSKRNGYYRLTAYGCLFIEGKVKAPAKFKILHNTCTGFEGEEISIQEALGVKFDYSLLMGIVPAGAKTDKEAKNGNFLFPDYMAVIGK